jgi:NhaP-type Na+/H+ or K+/H+ antiporter
LSRASTLLSRYVDDVPTGILIQFLTTFLVWMLAEWLHLSGIITVVTFAIMVARSTPGRTPARLRVPAYAVWDLAVFVLNVLAFILVGLQLKPILQDLDRARLLTYAATSAAICATVIIVRMAWVLGHVTIAITVRNRFEHRLTQPPLVAGLRTATAIGWCGMRGIVTLATALALPPGFAHRDFVLFAAFAVVLGTLVVQGATLSPLMRLLGLKDDGSIDREVRRARAETARAALESIVDPAAHDMVQLLHRKYRVRLQRAERASDESGAGAEDPIDDGAAGYLEVLRRAQSAERQILFDLRANGTIGDDAYHRVEEELDLAELNTDAMARQE